MLCKHTTYFIFRKSAMSSLRTRFVTAKATQGFTLSSLRRIWSLLPVVVFLSLSACSDSPLDPAHPVTLTLWHVYGAQTYSPMNELVDRFNWTVGKERGIVIEVTAVSNTSAIHEALVAATRLQPGAGDLPDLFTCYPKTLIAMGSERVLDWGKWFTEEELKAFAPQFLEEGYVDGALRLFPLLKSTNLLYVNATIFDQFSKETGITCADLSTWEGMFRASERYYQWSGGKAFFMYDEWLHYAMLNVESLGEPFFSGERIRGDSPAFLKVWEPLARAGLKGELCPMPGYATTAMMMGEAVCGFESSASILYFADTVTLPDNTVMPLRLAILPVPLFEGAKPVVLQRGSGLGALKSTPEREYAAAVFCKWLTSSEVNLPFAIQGGYMPVRKDSFARIMEGKNLPYPDDRYREQYQVLQKVYADSTFYVPPVFKTYDPMERGFSAVVRDMFKKPRVVDGNPVSQEAIDQTREELLRRVAALQDK